MIAGGADPGFDGAVAFVDVETRRVLGIVDMPVARKRSGRRELALHELVGDCIQALDGRRVGHLYIERVNSFAPGGRRMGASSAFSLGECMMALRMLAVCHGWPVTLIGAAQWKKAFSLGADKAQARLRASELLPEDAQLWTPKRGGVTVAQANGRAEATLLALYGIRTMQAIVAEKAAPSNPPPAEPEAPDTYAGISALQRAADAEMRRLKPLLEPEVVIVDGSVPKLTSGPWATGDLLGRERPTGVRVDGDDPSGVDKHRGPG